MSKIVKPVKWDVGPPEQWWKDKIDGAIAQTEYNGLPWTVTTECPRCHHQMSETLSRIWGVQQVEEWDPSKYPEFEFSCDCRCEHEGRPEGEEGCGWKADFKTPWNR